MPNGLEEKVARLDRLPSGVFTGSGQVYRDPNAFPEDEGLTQLFQFDMVVDLGTITIFANSVQVDSMYAPNNEDSPAVDLHYQTSHSGELNGFEVEYVTEDEERALVHLQDYHKVAQGSVGEIQGRPTYRLSGNSPIFLNVGASEASLHTLTRNLRWRGTPPKMDDAIAETDIANFVEERSGFEFVPAKIANNLVMYLADRGYLE